MIRLNWAVNHLVIALRVRIARSNTTNLLAISSANDKINLAQLDVVETASWCTTMSAGSLKSLDKSTRNGHRGTATQG
jgi:hypothetical protein